MALRTITIVDQKLPVGLYLFRVIELSEETDAKKGHDFFKVKLATVSLANGKVRTAWDRFPLTEEMSWKLGSFLISLGHERTEGGTISFDDVKIVTLTGYFECEENEVEKEGKTRTFTNYRYLKPNDEDVLNATTVEGGVNCEGPKKLWASLGALRDNRVQTEDSQQ